MRNRTFRCFLFSMAGAGLFAVAPLLELTTRIPLMGIGAFSLAMAMRYAVRYS